MESSEPIQTITNKLQSLGFVMTNVERVTDENE